MIPIYGSFAPLGVCFDVAEDSPFPQRFFLLQAQKCTKRGLKVFRKSTKKRSRYDLLPSFPALLRSSLPIRCDALYRMSEPGLSFQRYAPPMLFIAFLCRSFPFMAMPSPVQSSQCYASPLPGISARCNALALLVIL